MERAALLLVLLLATAPDPGSAGDRTWEVNGVRLEASQIERLARDIARQTVVAVQRIDGLRLREEQERRLEAIYHDVALEVYDVAVAVVAREDLPDAEKESRVRNLVLAGQERSTAQVAQVLEAAQYERYRTWEEAQVAAFRERGLFSGSTRRRGAR